TDLVRLASLHRRRAEVLDNFEPEYCDAIAFAERACRIAPDAEPARLELCRTLTALATRLNVSGHDRDALDVLDRAIAMIPSSNLELPWARVEASARGSRGRALLSLGCGDEAFDDLYRGLNLRRRLVAKCPADTEARNELMRSCNQVARAERDRGNL